MWTTMPPSASVVTKRCTSICAAGFTAVPNGRDLTTRPAIMAAVMKT